MTSDRVAEASATVRRNIRLLREGQSLTYVALSQKLDAIGCRIPILGLRRIERGERRVEVGELVAFADAFGVPPTTMLAQLICHQCAGSPPDGYSCRVCGAPEFNAASVVGSSSTLKAPTGGLTDVFLEELAAAYAEAVANGDHPAPAIAAQTGAAVRTVHRWIYQARKRGFLPEGTQGRAG